MSLNAVLLSLDKKLEEDNRFNRILKKLEKFIGIDRRKIVLGTMFILAASVIIGFGAPLICNLVGFVYPAYCSVIAIETKQKEDDTLWLTYWVVFASMSTFEFFSDFILVFIPFYWFLKCIFLIWCFIPFRINGSRIIYYRLIRPVFLSNVGGPEENAQGEEEHDKSS